LHAWIDLIFGFKASK
jgi:hypothetical protein